MMKKYVMNQSSEIPEGYELVERGRCRGELKIFIGSKNDVKHMQKVLNNNGAGFRGFTPEFFATGFKKKRARK